MLNKILYHYISANEDVFSPNQPASGIEYTTEYHRLIADADKILVNGQNKALCVDVLENEIANWSEQDAPTDEKELEELLSPSNN